MSVLVKFLSLSIKKYVKIIILALKRNSGKLIFSYWDVVHETLKIYFESTLLSILAF